jgi:hypothetical protein
MPAPQIEASLFYEGRHNHRIQVLSAAGFGDMRIGYKCVLEATSVRCLDSTSMSLDRDPVARIDRERDE